MSDNQNPKGIFVPPPLPQNDNSTTRVPKNAESKVQIKREGRKKKCFIFALLTVLTMVLAIYFVDRYNFNIVKEKLIRNNAYVRENMIGTWRYDSDAIMEITRNGWMINYMPEQDKTLDAEAFVMSELLSIGYNGYTVPEASLYTEAEVKAYAEYWKRLDDHEKIGIPVQANFFGVIPDKYGLIEFVDDDHMYNAGIFMTRIEMSNPIISDNLTGFYMEEEGNVLAIIEIGDTGNGYFGWYPEYEDGLNGPCTIIEDQIVLSLPYADDFAFRKNGSSLVKIGSNEVPGSQMQYEKLSDLSYYSYMLYDQIFDYENGYDIEDNYIINGNQPEVVSSTVDDIWFGITEFAQREDNIIYNYSDNGDYLTEFSISPLYEDLEDFMITTVEYDDDGTEYIGKILDYIGAVSVGEIVNMQFELMDLDTRGIVYSDRNGYDHGYAINTNGYDGSIVITPLARL